MAAAIKSFKNTLVLVVGTVLLLVCMCASSTAGANVGITADPNTNNNSQGDQVHAAASANGDKGQPDYGSTTVYSNGADGVWVPVAMNLVAVASGVLVALLF